MFIVSYTILYYTILYYTILYSSMLYYTILERAILYYSLLLFKKEPAAEASNRSYRSRSSSQLKAGGARTYGIVIVLYGMS